MAPREDLDDLIGSIRVLVVDDHDLFRTGLSALLGREGGIEVVGQASGGRAGVRLARELCPGVVLMDLSMPDVSGAQAMRAIISDRPSTRVVALTVLSTDEDIESALDAGASGFLSKDTPVEEVASAVRAAATGAAWLSPRAAAVVLSRMRQSRPTREPGFAEIDQLSARELDVLRLVARGMDNAQIAASLNISPQTAKNHISRILTKLRVPSRIHAAIYAIRHGLE